MWELAQACVPGEYCDGGPGVDVCRDSSRVDHDEDPATPCESCAELATRLGLQTPQPTTTAEYLSHTTLNVTSVLLLYVIDVFPRQQIQRVHNATRVCYSSTYCDGEQRTCVRIHTAGAAC